MSDFSRLVEKLTKLRGRERAPGDPRLLRGNEADQRIGAVVTEIDETILPRRLSFAVEGGATVYVAAANRRLQALLSPLPDVQGTEIGDLADKPLADAEDEAVGRIHAMLKTVLSGDAQVRIDAVRQQGVTFGSDIGVTASVLARIWDVSAPEEREPLSSEDVMTSFQDGLGDDVIAWLRIEGEAVTNQGGDATALEALGEQAAMFLDGYFSKFDQLYPGASGPVATVIAPMGDGPAVFFAEIEGLSIFASVKAGQAAALARRWQSLVI